MMYYLLYKSIKFPGWQWHDRYQTLFDAEYKADTLMKYANATHTRIVKAHSLADAREMAKSY